MSTKPMKPIKTPPKKLNIKDTESLKCDACGNYSFIKSYFIFFFISNISIVKNIII